MLIGPKGRPRSRANEIMPSLRRHVLVGWHSITVNITSNLDLPAPETHQNTNPRASPPDPFSHPLYTWREALAGNDKQGTAKQ